MACAVCCQHQGRGIVVGHRMLITQCATGVMAFHAGAVVSRHMLHMLLGSLAGLHTPVAKLQMGALCVVTHTAVRLPLLRE
jgi:hypothetical protein